MNEPLNGSAGPGRSQYYLSRNELLSGLANRFVFSSFYIWLYLSLALLSTTTVVLSLLSDCPTLAFYMLELVINLAMILEVGIRFLAFGKKFWSSYFNIIDLILMIFCMITVLVIFFSGCSAKGEEVFDTFLLVARNLIQFSRLAIVLRRSGRSIFTRIPAIDLSAAQDPDFYAVDFDIDDEEAELEDRRAAGGDLSVPSARNSRGSSPAPMQRQASASGSRAEQGLAKLQAQAGTGGSRPPSRNASGPPTSGQQPFLLAEDEDDDDDIDDLPAGSQR